MSESEVSDRLPSKRSSTITPFDSPVLKRTKLDQPRSPELELDLELSKMRDAEEDDEYMIHDATNRSNSSHITHDLAAIGISEFLDHDSRPTFIIDLDPDIAPALDHFNLSPVFCNTALHTYETLLDHVMGEAAVVTAGIPEEVSYHEFRSWVLSVTKFDDTKDVWPISFFWNGLLWTGSTIRRRWRLISGNKCYQTSGMASGNLSSAPPSEIAGTRTSGNSLSKQQTSSVAKRSNSVADARGSTRGPSQASTTLVSVAPVISDLADIEEAPKTATAGQESSSATIPAMMATSDWTAPDPTGVLTAHHHFARSIDWNSTPLGAMESWSAEFRQVANLLMTNPHPAALFWGAEYTLMYNEAYRDVVAGHKHPNLMGSGFKGTFAETFDALEPIFSECRRTGKAVSMKDQMLLIERRGFVEETYFCWSFVPLYGGGSEILGFWNGPYETTVEQVNLRRTNTVRRLGEEAALAKTIKAFWVAVMIALNENHFDVPFALLYSVNVETDENDASSTSSGSTLAAKSCVLEGRIGIKPGHPAAPERIDLKRSAEGFIPSFREAMRTREPTKLETRNGTFPEYLVEDIQWRGFGDACREAIIFPVRPTTTDTVLGFLLLGINPRRPYDSDYESFVNILNRQLATSLASVILFEDEIRRGRTAAEAAALERERLSDQLEAQTRRLQRMTEVAPVGMYYANAKGKLIETNERFFDITGHPRDNLEEMSWMNIIADECVPMATDGWRRLTEELQPFGAEFRLKKQWLDASSGEMIDAWILATSTPDFDAEGNFVCILGACTDISHLKWAQKLQNRRLEEAEETRRQQNNFIDITSHEMRNPLSAILQCADEISTAMADLQINPSKSNDNSLRIVQESMEAAETIAFCAQHQQGIVSDILTISKLDSDLLVLTPVTIQATAVAQRAIKMFDAECRKKEITMSLDISPSLKTLGVDWVLLDPSRLMQVLINLLTNAVKFTQGESKKSIRIRVGASLSPPTPELEGFEYIPQKAQRQSLTPATEEELPGAGEPLYLRFAVQDTGRGLTVDEKKLLFLRFSQASPRTHAQYGGSGLGLFISRQLTELQGGQIGVASEAGVGSTFGFYIRTRRSEQQHARALDSSLEPSLRQESQIAKMVTRREDVMSHRQNATNHTSKPQPDPEPMDLKALSILVVEDNMVNQKVMSKQLKKLGCIVNVASHGGEALDFLARTSRSADNPQGLKLSVVLMDLEMPVMDGMTAAKRIRALEAEGKLVGHTPVIAVTANVRFEQISEARDAGMDDVVSKPFRIPELMAKIEQVLSSGPAG